MEKIKIIEFFGEPLNYGGQEAFIINVYSKIDKTYFEFTFITPFECENLQLKEMIVNNGDHLIVDNKLFESKLRKKSILDTAMKYINNTYDIIHIHSGSVFTLYNVAKISKEKGIEKVIVHSHSTGKNNIKYKIIKYLSDRNITKYADYYFACSEDAAKFKFPKRIIENDLYQVITNGIDLTKYKFNEKIRQDNRKKLNINDDDIVLGNVGRLSDEKNQLFIIDILYELVKDNSKYKLLLIGEGPLKDKIVSKINNLKLNSNVIMLDKINDVYTLLMAMDIFIFPSKYEGFGLALIEAEAIGLPSLCSISIPDRTIINNNCIRIKDFLIKNWIDEIKKIDLYRKTNYDKLNLYSIDNTVKQIYNVYYKNK